MPRRLKGSLEETVDRLLPRVDRLRAIRGDVVLADAPEPSLGICLGRVAAFVSAAGMTTIPMSRIDAAWSV